MLPNFRIMWKKDSSFRIYQNLKITHAGPDHLFLAITQNWAMRLFVGFVMQGHILIEYVITSFVIIPGVKKTFAIFHL